MYASRYMTRIVPIYRKASIGIVGAYKIDNLPPVIVEKISRGLTYVDKDGSIKPDIATSWEELENGKKFVFHLRKDVYFNDGKNVTSNEINYSFSDVEIERPDKYTIIFKLKDSYAPFLITVSKPIFEKGTIGVNDYRVEGLKTNGNFVQSLTLVSVKNRFDMITYLFYPSEEALKMALLLGEITEASGLSNPAVKDTSFEKFPNLKVDKKVNYSRLVTLFYNNLDGSLSDRKIRLALSYALPENYQYGEKAFLPYSPQSLYFNYSNEIEDRKQDFSRAKLLVDSVGTASQSAELPKTLAIKTLPKYYSSAKDIAAAWKQLGVDTQILTVDRIPDNFQVFLGDFTIPKDPDQYILWHSGQTKNITKYKNLRIDKLLEEGRKTTDPEVRKSIYGDFQKFLFEDAPSAFLYFPYEYEITRK